MPIFMSKSLFHLSVVWRVPCVPATALGNRCHLQGPVTATMARQELAAQALRKTCSHPLRVTTAPKRSWSSRFKGVACQGHLERTEEGETWLVLAFRLFFLGVILIGNGQGHSFSATRCQQWAGQMPALCAGLGRRLQHHTQRAETVLPAAL